MSATATVTSPPAFERPLDRSDEVRAPRDAVRFLELLPHRCVMLDGDGPPGAEAFAPRLPGLYAAAYGLRFALKRRGLEIRVGLLEGLWWTADQAINLDAMLEGDRAAWRWTLLIALPDEATEGELAAALDAGRAKLDPALAPRLRLETFAEGRVAQILHLGPYEAERPTIERLHAEIVAAGLRPRGRHHELYLGDPRRSAPARLKTLLRQPVG